MAFTFDQISTILNKIVGDVTGQNPAPGSYRTTKDFVAAATTALSAGTDPIMHSISQMIGRTIFSIRPYDAATNLIDQDALTYGNAVRKITPIFIDGAENQPMYDDQPQDGQSTDHYIIKRPKALETRFTGFSQWEVQAPTIFEDQLRSAFTGPDQLGEFISAQMTAVANEVNSQKEALARNTIVNLMAAKMLRQSADVRHVLTEYNAATGQSIGTIAELYSPAYFESFVKWFVAYIEDISDLMTRRSVKYHEPLTGYTIMRHTPKRDQRLLVYSFLLKAIKAMALSGIYNESLLKMDVTAGVEFWQSMNARMDFMADASYTAADGSIATGGVHGENIIGILFDRDAMGMSILDRRVLSTPLNESGLYRNIWVHGKQRVVFDNTEKVCLLLLD